MWASFCTSPTYTPARARIVMSCKEALLRFLLPAGILGAHPPPGVKGAATVALNSSGHCTCIYYEKKLYWFPSFFLYCPFYYIPIPPLLCDELNFFIIISIISAFSSWLGSKCLLGLVFLKSYIMKSPPSGSLISLSVDAFTFKNPIILLFLRSCSLWLSMLLWFTSQFFISLTLSSSYFSSLTLAIVF